ncbi:MAG: thiamine phosphate synthase [Desulfopila sp.]
MKILVITASEDVSDEVATIEALFAAGLEILHLRKPGFAGDAMEKFIGSIAVRYHQRIMLHSHHELVERYGLRGIHFPARKRSGASPLASNVHISTSCHSLAEVEQDAAAYEYVMVSPVFDSISKPGYRAAINRESLSACCGRFNRRVVALGGITSHNLTVLPRGCWGAAVLGHIWGHERCADRLHAFMNLQDAAQRYGKATKL